MMVLQFFGAWLLTNAIGACLLATPLAPLVRAVFWLAVLAVLAVAIVFWLASAPILLAANSLSRKVRP